MISTPTEVNLFSGADKKFLDTKLGLADLVCATLLTLLYLPEGWAEVPSGRFPYSFDVVSSSSIPRSTHVIPLELVRICLKLLKTLLPRSNSGYLYSADLVSTFERGHLHSSLSSHINAASKVAADCMTRSNEISSKMQTNALGIIRAAMEFISSSADYPELVSYLTQGGFVFRLFASNKLLQESCRRWEGLPDNLSHMRGYTARRNETQPFKVSLDDPLRGTFYEDSSHSIWLLTLQSVSSILRTSLSSSKTFNGNVNPFLNDILSFLRTYEATILSGLVIHKRGVSFRVTLNGLNETQHCLMLLKEMCSKSAIRYFMSSAPELLKRLLNGAVKAMRNLCAFLQSTCVARDLFSAVLKVQALENNTAIVDSPTMQEIMILSTFNSGSSAKHDILKHAQYAKSCCLNMTIDDTELLKATGGKVLAENGEKMARSPSDLTHNTNIFRKSVDNDFVRKLECIAAQCILHVLTVITRAHPAISSWIYFQNGEMLSTDISSFLKRGTNVFILSTRGDILHAKVLSHCDPYTTVQYNGDVSGKKVDRVLVNQIVGIQDAATRLSALKFDVAMSSSTEAATSKESLGHLILQLRWCKQFWLLEPSQHALVQCLAERSASLLAFELVLHQESVEDGIESDFSSSDKKALLNQQLLELFDDTVDTNTSRVTDSSPLKKIISAEVWLIVTNKLQRFLQEGRAERDSMQDKNFRSPRNTWSRKRRTTNISRVMQTPTQPESKTRSGQAGLQTPFFTPKN